MQKANLTKLMKKPMANKDERLLYGGDVEITFYPDSHRYKKKGERTYLISVTSATGIIDKSRPLLIWASRLSKTYLYDYLSKSKVNKFTAEELYPIIDEAVEQHTVKKEEAASIGSEVHEWVEMFTKAKIAGETVDESSMEGLSEQALNGVNAFLDWYNSNNVEFHQAERLVYSRKHDYAGITDVIVTYNGKKAVGDYKTAKSIYSDHRYQLSGYWEAVEEEDGEKFDFGLILHFDKETGKFHVEEITREEHELNLPVFLACLTVKRREKALSKW